MGWGQSPVAECFCSINETSRMGKCNSLGHNPFWFSSDTMAKVQNCDSQPLDRQAYGHQEGRHAAHGFSILGDSTQYFSVAARRLREAIVSPGDTDEVSKNNLE